jgi:release factor glutamine methyltransferase
MRQFSPYEYNHLKRHGIDPEHISESDTTPVEYLAGAVEFAGREWHITPDALIPRIETEELLAHALATAEKIQKLLPPSQPLNWIEVGTGSAALGLSFWLKLKEKNILNQGILSDISAAALKVAKQNASTINATTVIVESDLFGAIDPAQRFDVVMANLPYIPTERIAYLDESVKDHEPDVALDGGSDGLFLIKGLLKQLPDRLSAYGSAWLEIDYTHTKEELNEDPTLQEALSKLELISHFDQFQRQRFWEVKLKS